MTATWVDVPWLCLDTETTGVDVETDRIVQVAVATVHPDGTVTDAWEAIVDPGIDIPDGAAEVHGITTDRARTEGVTPAEALTEIGRRLYATDIARTPVVMFNARFDWPLVLCEADRHGVDVPFACPVLDPYLVDRMVDQYRKGSRKLTVVADHYGVVFEGEAHGALADAVAAGRVMRAIVARHPEIAARTLASVWLRQARGFERWRLGFNDYLRQRQGPDAEQVTPGWPIPCTTGPRGPA